MKASGGRGLSWGAALRVAWRECQAAPGKFLFVIVSVAIGVAALTGFTNSFQRSLSGQARNILAADVSARMFRRPTATELADLNGLRGVERTQVTEMVSMASASSDPIPLLVSLKAVDPARYPFYGEYKLRPAGSLRQELTPGAVLVSEDLLIRLHTQIGDTLKVGNSTFRIAGVIEREPDRMNSSMGIGPRVLISRQGLAQTGLLQPGSRAGERFLMRLDPRSGASRPARATGEDSAGCAGDGLPRRKSRADPRAGSREQHVEFDLSGGDGAGGHRCRDVDARAS